MHLLLPLLTLLSLTSAQDHFYCTDPRGELAPQSGYEREGPTGYVYKTASVPGLAPVYRWYNPRSGDHFYTRDQAGELAPAAGYRREGTNGIEYYLFPSFRTGTVALYRFWNAGRSDHFYTTSSNAEGAAGYVGEGIIGYVYVRPTSGAVALNRWYHSGLTANFVFDNTISAAQKSQLLERWSWVYWSLRNCAASSISAADRARVQAKFRQAIRHSLSTNRLVQGVSTLGGNTISINFNNVFPLGELEIARFLMEHICRSAGLQDIVPFRAQNCVVTAI